MNMLFRNFDDCNRKCSTQEFEDFISLPENESKNFELIEGSIIMFVGNATPNHLRICQYISRKIGNYLEGKQCEVFQDLNVYLYKNDIEKCENIFQPDVLVNCSKNKITNKGSEGTPEFIIEVVSKSTMRNDYFIKHHYYMEFGVNEYWIVDLAKNQILVYLNAQDGTSPLINKYTFDDCVTIGLFNDLAIDFKEILKTLDLH